MRFAVILLLVSVGYGQQTKVFQFTHDQSPSDLDEFATVLKGIVGIPRLSVDNAARTLTVNAPDKMIRMAASLSKRLCCVPPLASKLPPGRALVGTRYHLSGP